MRWIIAGLALLGATTVAPSPVDASHSCATILDRRPVRDAATTWCGSGTGYFQTFALCYSIVWIVEDGVVVGTKKSYRQRESAVAFKFPAPIEPSDTVSVRCGEQRPFIEDGWYVKWH